MRRPRSAEPAVESPSLESPSLGSRSAAPSAGPTARLAALPRSWIAALLLVAALNLAVVAAVTAAHATQARTAGFAPLVAALDGADLVRGGALVHGAAVRTGEEHTLLVDPSAAAGTADGFDTRLALVLAGDGIAIVDGDQRWTIPYDADDGALTAGELVALLAGWNAAQRVPALAFAVLTGLLTTALSAAVLALGVRFAGRGTITARAALAWWSVALAGTGVVAATAVLVTDGAVGRTAALASTLVAATLAFCLLALADVRRRMTGAGALGVRSAPPHLPRLALLTRRTLTPRRHTPAGASTRR